MNSNRQGSRSKAHNLKLTVALAFKGPSILLTAANYSIIAMQVPKCHKSNLYSLN